MRLTTSAALYALFLATGVDAFFRINCAKILTGRVDPIVNPGAIAQHAHTIVGGSNLGVSSTYNTLLNSECTSCQIAADKSAYWTPLLYYQYPNGSFIDVPHGGAVAYYLSRGILAKNTIPFPKGFQMLSGDKGARSYDNHTYTFGNATYPGRPVADRVSFACLAEQPQREQPYLFSTNCINGLRAQIHFQSCWDGVNLYKADNSHVAYLSDIDNGICPPTHPYILPHLFLETNYAVSQVPNQQPGGRFVFSQGDTTGYGFHGDFQNGWQMDVLQEAVNTCLYNEGSFGTIEECPALMRSSSNAYNYNCPERQSPIDEPVRGLLSKLPGCIQITSGPDAAPNSAMSCPSGTQPPRIIPTQDSKPKTTARPVPGTMYGLDNNMYLGCYNDSAGGIRALNAISTSNYTVMTPQYCQKYCTDRGYRLSGVEYAQECHCDNYINPTSRSGYDTCSWNCGGSMTSKSDRVELCGGYGMINIYNNTDPSFNATGDTSNSAGNAPVYGPLAAFPSNYLGCYSDGGARTLTGKNLQANNMSAEVCQAFCSQGAGYQFYGTEYGQQCWCGNGIASKGVLLTPTSNPSNSTCQMRCLGSGDQICGGPNTLSLYNNTDYVSPGPAPRVGKYDSIGCVSDPAIGGRALQGASMTDKAMDNGKCVKFCLGKGFHYAGVEYGTECYCGNEIKTQTGAQNVTCPVLNMITCPNNIKQWCGASKLMNVWYNPNQVL